MSDQLLRSFAQRAVAQVPPADFDELVERGARVRRRRRSGVAAGAATALGLAGYALSLSGDPRTAEPADLPDRTRVEATPYPGGSELPHLEAGTYELRLSADPARPRVTFTVPDGWRGWIGPNRFIGEEGYVGLLAVEVDEVVTRPCTAWRGLRPVDTASELVEGLTRMPRHRVVAGPQPDDRFGHPAVHLRLRTGDVEVCPRGADFQLWDYTYGTIQSAGTGALMDLWVVDVGPRPVLIAATSMPQTPRWALEELEDVVASVELRVTP